MYKCLGAASLLTSLLCVFFFFFLPVFGVFKHPRAKRCRVAAPQLLFSFFSPQACIDGSMDMVSFLLDQNANVNQPDSEGWTPLHVAASCGHPEIVECVARASPWFTHSPPPLPPPSPPLILWTPECENAVPEYLCQEQCLALFVCLSAVQLDS